MAKLSELSENISLDSRSMMSDFSYQVCRVLGKVNFISESHSQTFSPETVFGILQLSPR